MSSMSKSVMAGVAVVLLAGGCAPQMKTAGYVGGTALLVTGTAARLNAQYGEPPDDLGLLLGEYYFGTAAAITGAVILMAALMSPSEHGASTPAAAPAPPSPSLGPWPSPAPSRSPSAPSGSPLAPAASPALSMRGPGALAFH